MPIIKQNVIKYKIVEKATGKLLILDGIRMEFRIKNSANRMLREISYFGDETYEVVVI